MMDTASLDANSTLPCHYYLNREPAGDSTSRMPQTLVEYSLYLRENLPVCLSIAQMDLEVQILLLNLLH